MEGCEVVVSPLANVCRERRNCPGVIRLQIGKRLEVTLRRVPFILFNRERFECPQRFGFASQHQITNRPSMEILGLRRERRTDANAGAEPLVCGLEPRCYVDGVAIGGVIEEPSTAKVSDDRWSGMDPDPRHSELD